MLKIITMVVTPFQQNARILIDTESQRAVVVDPGGEVDRIWSALKASGAKVEAILLTHAHIDHGGGVAHFLRLYKEEFAEDLTLISSGEEEREMRGTLSKQALLFGFSPTEYEDVKEPDVVVVEGDEVSVGACVGKVLFTPGHSPGHISIAFPELEYCGEYLDVAGNIVEEFSGDGPVLVAGDTLFAGSIGRTDLPGGDHETLLRSIKEKLLTLPESTRVLSGHGPDSRIGTEKTTNPFLT